MLIFSVTVSASTAKLERHFLLLLGTGRRDVCARQRNPRTATKGLHEPFWEPWQGLVVLSRTDRAMLEAPEARVVFRRAEIEGNSQTLPAAPATMENAIVKDCSLGDCKCYTNIQAEPSDHGLKLKPKVELGFTEAFAEPERSSALFALCLSSAQEQPRL